MLVPCKDDRVKLELVGLNGSVSVNGPTPLGRDIHVLIRNTAHHSPVIGFYNTLVDLVHCEQMESRCASLYSAGQNHLALPKNVTSECADINQSIVIFNSCDITLLSVWRLNLMTGLLNRNSEEPLSDGLLRKLHKFDGALAKLSAMRGVRVPEIVFGAEKPPAGSEVGGLRHWVSKAPLVGRLFNQKK